MFRVRREVDGVRLLPVRDRPPVRLADLVGYRQQKEQLVRNTEAFLHGRGGNNVLLYGDAGTGKSTSVQAIANETIYRGVPVIAFTSSQDVLQPTVYTLGLLIEEQVNRVITYAAQKGRRRFAL